MATMCGPERPLETPTMQRLGSSNNGRRSLSAARLDESTSTAAVSSTAEMSLSSTQSTLPPPNPPFVFPMRQPSPSPPTPLHARPNGRRPRSVVEGVGISSPGVDKIADRRMRSPALPDFTFNPGASLPRETASLLSPPLSPHSPKPLASPSRPGVGHGHKRGGSEFVGGKLRDGDSITVMGTSPTKSESGFASPDFQPPPPARRGRHSHRRSAALSGQDLSLILQPTNANANRGSSAPTSPIEFNRKESSALQLNNEIAKPVDSDPTVKNPPVLPESPLDSSISGASGTSSPQGQKPVPRARVGFSETIEFIPRPLSLVSSDTSSTVTARPSHSVSGSISSVISATTRSATPPVVEEKEMPLLSPPQDESKLRPRTAGAKLEHTNNGMGLDIPEAVPRRRNSNPTLASVKGGDDEGSPSSSPPKTPKRWSFFGLEPFTNLASQDRSRPRSSSSSESTARRHSPPSSCSEHSPDSVIEAAPEQAPQSKRKSKKTRKKKVKTWAGSILARKPKHRTKKAKGNLCSSPTPMPEPTEEPVASSFDVLPEVIVDPAPPSAEFADPTATIDLDRPTLKSRRDDDGAYPMIDLDAALGPFNTPLPNNPEWEAAQKAAGGGNSRRQMHSAQGLKGFSGPGMHYHRRAESAPEMVPFEAGRFAIHRFGSSSTMADVFEEEEEDNDTSKTEQGDDDTTESKTDPAAESSNDDSQVPTPGCDDQPIQPKTAVPLSVPRIDETALTEPAEAGLRQSAVGSVEADRSSLGFVKSEKSLPSIRDEIIYVDASEVRFATTNAFHNHSPATSATPSPRRMFAGRDLPPVDISPLQLPTLPHAPVSPYSMSHGSSFPSPMSPMSCDAQCISTAASSVNDDNNFQSLLLGEPGPEVRVSVDVPSLASSCSTTRRSCVLPNGNYSQPLFIDKRPASVSSAAFGRRRSSLASLSRLISSSHGERSKLSMEVPCDDEPEKSSKISKSKRLSRMMQFWKPKDAPSS